LFFLINAEMEFPPEWTLLAADQFATAQPRSPGELGVELMVQARPNGRMMDHFRVSLGGSRILDINFALSSILSSPRAKTWRLKMQVWPRDVDVRRNMTSTAWQDVEVLISTKECQIVSEGNDGSESPVAFEEAAACLKEAGAAIRYAVVIGGDQRLLLMLQGLPASADQLLGKPAFRG
jgi:hypothetical protein